MALETLKMTMKKRDTCYCKERDRSLRKLRLREGWKRTANLLRRERSRGQLKVKTQEMPRLRNSRNFSKKNLGRSRERQRLPCSLRAKMTWRRVKPS